MSTRRPIFFSRPADRTLEAFKEWIAGMAKALGDNTDDASGEPTEDEWREGWRRFWGVESQAPEASSEQSESDVDRGVREDGSLKNRLTIRTPSKS